VSRCPGQLRWRRSAAPRMT